MALIPDDAKAPLDVLRSVGGDEMLAMMMRTYVEFADERVPAMAAEAAAGHLKETAAIAHSLKSSSRQLGAMALGDACQVVEEAGKAGDAARASSGVAVVQSQYATARVWMNALATAS